jgi:hypothetical protein
MKPADKAGVDSQNRGGYPCDAAFFHAAPHPPRSAVFFVRVVI